MPSLEELTAEKSRLETERDIAQARVDIRELTAMAEQGSIVMEAFGDLIDRKEYLHDDPTFGAFTSPVSRLDDRSDGRYRPIYETEVELAMIRGAAHIITTAFGSAINILTNLTSYTISSGFTHEAKAARKDCPAGLAEACQHVIDTFNDENDWQSDMESELHWRSREDGEAPVVLKPNGWHTRASFIEPDQITQPAAGYELERWLGCDSEYVSSWTFGVHSRARDCSHALGYHVVHDGAGRDWDYYPATDVPLAMRLGSSVMELVKRNVPRNAKRGVSDFYPVLRRLERAEKLGGNIEESGAIQAAIAFIREHAPTATQGQIQSLISANKIDAYNKPLGAAIGGGSRITSRQNFKPGTIIDTNGTQYKYGPMGQSSAPNFIDIIQSALRSAGSRWAMPEYMISADASNANYASTLVAGSPFIQAREADQRFYGSQFHRIDWIVLRIAFEAGYFQRFGMEWEQLEAVIDVIVTPPGISITSKLEQAQTNNIERQNGALSAKTWMQESGRDPEVEQANIKAEGGVPGVASGTTADGQTAAFGNLNRRQWTNNSKAIKDVLAELTAGTKTTGQAEAMLQTLGLPADLARKLMADVADDGKLSAESRQAIETALLESEEGDWMAAAVRAMDIQSRDDAVGLLESGGGNPNHDSHTGEFASGGGGSGANAQPKQSGKATRTPGKKQPAPGEKQPSDRAARAKASHNPSTKEKQDASESLEGQVAKSLGAVKSDDNRPMDVTARNGMVGLEVKMMHDCKEGRVNMRPDSRGRKEAWIAEKKGRKAYTVLIDNRDKFQGGKHAGKYSGHRVYWKEGVGAFRLDQMNKAGSLSDLKTKLGI